MGPKPWTFTNVVKRVSNESKNFVYLSQTRSWGLTRTQRVRTCKETSICHKPTDSIKKRPEYDNHYAFWQANLYTPSVYVANSYRTLFRLHVTQAWKRSCRIHKALQRGWTDRSSYLILFMLKRRMRESTAVDLLMMTSPSKHYNVTRCSRTFAGESVVFRVPLASTGGIGSGGMRRVGHVARMGEWEIGREETVWETYMYMGG
jgi:hypothetical protein